jgi:hypothetical protein
MAQTVISGKQVKDSTIQRVDLDTSTVGQAVVTKIVQGSGITLSSTGADSGTGDVTVSRAPVSSPVVLGETATDPSFPSGIVVPSYANHSDQIWIYGSFDDHFDGASVNPKWVRTYDASANSLVYTQIASKLVLGVASPAFNTTAYRNSVAQQLPAQTTHDVRFQVSFGGFVVATSSSATSAWYTFSLEYGAEAGGVKLFAQAVQASSGATFYNMIYAGYGAGFGGAGNTYVSAILPPYWRIVYDATQTTTISFSFDGITWMQMAVITGAQSGFSTNAPTQFRLAVYANWQGISLGQFDWIKYV